MDLLILNKLTYPILTVLIFMPVTGAISLLFIRNETVQRVWTFMVTLMTFAASIPLFSQFDSETARFQFAEYHPWIKTFNINYVLGVDGISMTLIMLTTFIMPLCVLCSWKYISARVREFMICLLFIEAACIGVFSSLDFVLFYIFWEAMLVPMFLLIAIWGGPRKAYASVKFFIYTLAGSVLLLVAIIALYLKTGTFFIPDLMRLRHLYGFDFQIWIFLAFFVAFAVKVPMFPFHTWLPAAHVEAPTAGSVVLASILLKMGAYGFLRFSLAITTDATIYLAPVMIVISLAGIIYGGYIALVQSDMKKLIAYSSVGHMGFATLGIFILSPNGITGAIMAMLAHGISTGALFLCIGIVYERTHSRLIKDNQGIAGLMPIYIFFFGVFCLASFAFPGTCGFVAEILIFFGVFAENKITGAVAILGALLAATYILRLLQKICWGGIVIHHGNHNHDENDLKRKNLFTDLNPREIVYLLPLIIMVFWMGVSPGFILNAVNTTVQNLVAQINSAQITVTVFDRGPFLAEIFRNLFWS